MPISSTSGMQMTSAILSMVSTIGSAWRTTSIAGKKPSEPTVSPRSLAPRVTMFGSVLSIWPP